jgi:ribonucleoside-diphosphate reductase alpha chain
MHEVNPYFEKTAKEMGFYTKELLDKIAEKGSLKEFKEIPEKVKKVYITAHDISPEDHIRMQAAFQRYTDNAVSKTVNFPHTATKEDVEKAYELSYKLGCKGVTVYRDGSRDEQVLSVGGKKTGAKAEYKERRPRQRPKVTRGSTFLMHTGCGKMYVTVNEDEQGACEVFTQLGKSGGCTSSQAEAVSRLISLALRSGISQEEIIYQLRGIRCPSPTLAEGGAILSCADAIAKALDNYIKDRAVPGLFVHHALPPLNEADAALKPAVPVSINKQNLVGSCPQCPECGEMLEFGEGCVVCRGCGYSKCW